MIKGNMHSNIHGIFIIIKVIHMIIVIVLISLH
jgi:hypothetical protein